MNFNSLNYISGGGDIWLNDTQLVVGVGDMRDGVAYTYSFELNGKAEYPVVIGFYDDNHLMVGYHKNNPPTITKVPHDEIEHCSSNK